MTLELAFTSALSQVLAMLTMFFPPATLTNTDPATSASKECYKVTHGWETLSDASLDTPLLAGYQNLYPTLFLCAQEDYPSFMQCAVKTCKQQCSTNVKCASFRMDTSDFFGTCSLHTANASSAGQNNANFDTYFKSDCAAPAAPAPATVPSSAPPHATPRGFSNFCCNGANCLKTGEAKNVFLAGAEPAAVAACSSCETCAMRYDADGNVTDSANDESRCMQYYFEDSLGVAKACTWDASEPDARKKCKASTSSNALCPSCCSNTNCLRVGEANNVRLNGTSIGTCNSCKTCSREYNEITREQLVPKEDQKERCMQYYVEENVLGAITHYPCVWDDTEVDVRKKCKWSWPLPSALAQCTIPRS